MPKLEICKNYTVSNGPESAELYKLAEGIISSFQNMLAFINNFKPAPVPTLETIVQDFLKTPYDVNCSIAVPPILENERVAVVPFVPSLHAEDFFESFNKANAELSKYLPLGIGSTVNEFIGFVETRLRRQENAMLFTIIDKTKPTSSDESQSGIKPSGRVAGLLGWINISPGNFALELGPVIVLPEFQGTFVSSNAIGLMLKHLLDIPSQGGMGFRRVVWGADQRNEKSISVAEKIGFKKEGVLRWHRVLPAGRAGKPVSDKRKTPEVEHEADGRDSVILSICWDDWICGTREIVEAGTVIARDSHVARYVEDE